MTVPAAKVFLQRIARYLISIWVMLTGLKIAFGLVAVWISLQDDINEALVIHDFLFYAILSWLFILTGYLSSFTYKETRHPRFIRVFLVSYGFTVLAVLLYCFKPMGYEHALLQLDLYDLFISLTPSRVVQLALPLLVLGAVTMPQLLHRPMQRMSRTTPSSRPSSHTP